MRVISTKAHGYMDRTTSGTPRAMPRVLSWDPRLTRMLSTAAPGMLGYSLLTRYEFGLVKLLPMKAHLALDAVNGAAPCGTPVLFPGLDAPTKRSLVGMGLFEIAAALTTHTEPVSGETDREAIAWAAETAEAMGRAAAGPEVRGPRLAGAVRSVVGLFG